MSSSCLAPFLVASLAIAPLGVAGCKGHQESSRPAKDRKAAPADVDEDSRTIAGMRFLEVVTGGASAGEALPLVVFFHALGGTPKALRPRFAAFPVKARVILPYGPNAGDTGGFGWFPGPQFTPEGRKQYARLLPGVEEQTAAAILAVAAARPTVGKPIAAGFSRGAGIVLALALWHPDLLAAACPMAGELPIEVFAGRSAPATKPVLHAFIGDADPYNPDEERTVEGFKALGYVADLQVLRGVGHTFDPAAPAVLACLERAARAAAAAAR
jgi:phospholipase/carboxylesterase